MTNSPHKRAQMVAAALGLFPPLIRKSLLNDQNFKGKYRVTTEAMISFGSSGICIQRSKLFAAIRAVLAGDGPAELTDEEDRIWNLTNDAREVAPPILVFAADHQRLVLPDFSVLSGDPATRIRSFVEFALDVSLPLSSQKEWRRLLEERALEDDEVDAFNRDLRDTPVHVERTIKNEITAGKSNVSTLVPHSRTYFERLVGVYDGSGSIRDFAVGRGRELFEHLTEWRPYEGFLFSLLLSSHSALTAEIKVEHLNKVDLEKAFDYLETHGDMLSRLGAFEVGLRILPDRPEIEPFLLPLVHRIRDDDVEGLASEFNLFSASFILVDGELARTRVFAEEPPFYRRLASLAQAALIHRQIIKSSIDYQKFADWAVSNCGEHYYMQSLADMRAEPRWNPDMAAASQLRADFIGRIMIAASNFDANLGAGKLRETILGDGEQSLIRVCESPRQYFPGPLEGGEDSSISLPDDLARVIEENLESEEVEAASFIAIVNSATIFSITPGHAKLAANALRRVNYTLSNLDDKFQLVGILNGLATVAAVSRNPALADELRILVRRYRRDSQYSFGVEDAMRMALVAAAAREDLMEWREFVGAWLTELAFGELEGNDGETLHCHLSALLHSVPQLWVSCARADAALQAWRCR